MTTNTTHYLVCSRDRDFFTSFEVQGSSVRTVSFNPDGPFFDMVLAKSEARTLARHILDNSHCLFEESCVACPKKVEDPKYDTLCYRCGESRDDYADLACSMF